MLVLGLGLVLGVGVGVGLGVGVGVELSISALVLATCYLPPTTYYLLPTTYYLLPTTYHLLPATYTYHLLYLQRRAYHCAHMFVGLGAAPGGAGAPVVHEGVYARRGGGAVVLTAPTPAVQHHRLDVRVPGEGRLG